MCIYEYSLLTSCESSAKKLTEVRIFGLDFFFFVTHLERSESKALLSSIGGEISTQIDFHCVLFFLRII